MPYYPYTCLDCHRRFEVFLSYSEYGKKLVACPKCSSERVQRRIGRVRIARSDDSRMEELADPSNLAGLDDDPRALGRMMQKMRSEMGDELGGEMGPEFDEVVGRLESGQSPEDIEQAMPDLGTSGGSDDIGL